MVYNIKSGHGKPDSKNKGLYDVIYKCGYCGSELEQNISYNCGPDGKVYVE